MVQVHADFIADLKLSVWLLWFVRHEQIVQPLLWSSQRLSSVYALIRAMIRGKKFMAILFLVLCSGCVSERDQHIRAYNQQLVFPKAHIRTYSDMYARHKALCNTKDVMAKYNCNQMKADLASIQEAERQALPIYEQMASDPVLNQQDREIALQSVTKLRADLEEPQ